MDRYWHLKNTEWFENLPGEVLSQLESRTIVRRFTGKQVVYFPADPSKDVLLLIDGRVKIKTITPDGKETILAFVEPGELFGELSIVDDGPRGEFAEAVGASSICAIAREAVLELMETQPATSLRITKFIGLRRRRIENRIKNMLFRPFRDRVLFLLAELADRYGEPEENGRLRITLGLSHQEIASLVGATRETVTLMLGELQGEDLIRVKRRRIVILDTARLLESVDSASFPELREMVHGRDLANRSNERGGMMDSRRTGAKK